MKRLAVMASLFIIFAFASPSWALFKPASKIRYLNLKMESRVEELMKVEFFKPATAVGTHTKKELLLKQLRELLYKNSKTI